MTPEEQAAYDKMAKALAAEQAARAAAETRATEAEAMTARVAGDAEVSVALIAKGITDPDDRDVILSRYNKLDPEGRPAFGKWFDKAAKSDRTVSRIASDVAASASKGKGAEDTEATPEDKAGKADPAPEGKAGKAEAAPLPNAPAGKTAPAPAPKGWTPERMTNAPLDEVRKNIAEIRKEYGYG